MIGRLFSLWILAVVMLLSLASLTEAATSSPTVLPTSGPPTYSNISAIYTSGFNSDSTDPKTQLSIYVKLVSGSVDAIVYCAAFATALQDVDVIPFTSTNDILKQNFYSYSSSQIAHVLITGLIPSSTYNVFCMTISTASSDIRMPYSVAVKHKTLSTTECCKMAIFNAGISSLFTKASSVGLSSALTVTLSAYPNYNLTISMVLYNVRTGSVDSTSAGTLTPSTFTVYNSYIPNTPIPIVLVAGDVGLYGINFTISGRSFDEFKTDYTGFSTISVLSTDQEPSPPVMTSATFSSDGTYVTVLFDSPTNQGGYPNTFPCNVFLYFDGMATATCSWKDYKTIIIYPSYSDGAAVLDLDSPVSLYSDTIQAYCTDLSTMCSNWVHYSAATTVLVKAPSSVSLPIVVMSGPSAVSLCSPIILDLSNSVGAGGRPWYSTQVNVSDSQPNASITYITALLQSNEYLISPPTPIPSNWLITGHDYVFTATFCNFLGACGTASKAVYVSDATAAPIVSINGLTTRTMNTWSTLLVNAAAYTQNCDGVESVAGLQYTWSLYLTGVSDTLVSAASISQNPAVFKLAPYSLTVGNTYRVQVSVKTSTSDSVTASVFVIVRASNLVAVLKDGASRSVQVGNAYTIDASGSYDQDVAQVAGVAQTGLSFSWACYQTLPTFASSCPVTMSTSATGSILTIGTSGATAGSVAHITVTVYDATRSTTAYTDITLTLLPASIITISSSASSLKPVNVNEQITLTGSLSLVHACDATWSVDDPTLDLSFVSQTATVVSLTTLKPSLNTIALLIPGGTLPQRATLGFSLTCDGVTSVLSLTTNGSPFPGVFVVIPSAGVELTTSFSFTAKQWSDPDLPLSYSFGFISPTTDALLLFRGKSERSYTSTELPAGPSTSNYQMSTTLIVYDVYGASSSLQGNVTVVPAASVAAQLTGIASLLASSSGSVDDTNAVIATAGTVLNIVNCTGSPSCSSLHRAHCSATPNTCGICLPGYLGVSGDDNSACVTLSEFANAGARRRLTVGQSCTSNSDCNAANWESCSSSTNKCVQQAKSCPNSCSGHGACIYSSISTGYSQDACVVSDVTCQAECVCTTGYAGTDCGLTIEDLVTRQALRSQLIQGLENVTMIDDINEQSIQSWATSVASLSRKIAELTIEEAAIIDNIVSLTIQYAISLGTTDYSALLGLLQALDSAGTVYITEDRRRRRLGMDRRLTTAGANDILAIAGSFSKVVANGMALDQTSAIQIHNNFRMSTQINTAKIGSTIDVVAPQTDLEYYSVASTPYLSLAPGASSSSVTSGMVIANAVNYAGIEMNSNPMQIIVGSDSGLTKMTYAVYNNVPTDNLLPSYVSPYFITFCDTTVRAETYTCPSGKVLTNQCFGVAGTITQQCDLPAPQCSVLDTASGTTSPGAGCRVLDSPFSAEYTTCECTLSGNRRLSTQNVLGESGITNMVTTSTYIATQFTSTFTANFTVTTDTPVKMPTVAPTLNAVYAFKVSQGLTGISKTEFESNTNNTLAFQATVKETMGLKDGDTVIVDGVTDTSSRRILRSLSVSSIEIDYTVTFHFVMYTEYANYTAAYTHFKTALLDATSGNDFVTLLGSYVETYGGTPALVSVTALTPTVSEPEQVSSGDNGKSSGGDTALIIGLVVGLGGGLLLIAVAVSFFIYRRGNKVRPVNTVSVVCGTTDKSDSGVKFYV